jgi:guanylate kinase
LTLLILAAVSGTGKSTIGQRLRAQNPNLKLSVSHTTRGARPQERDGEHYHFIGEERFKEMVADEGFAEWAEYVGNLYGTAKSTVENAADRHEDLFFDIEILGAQQLKAAYPEALSVFLLPPSMEELERRLRARGTDSHEAINERLARGRLELLAAREFDYLVVNDRLEDAVTAIEEIYRSQSGCQDVNRMLLESLIEVYDR